MVRIAAIHHTQGRLAEDGLAASLIGLLRDGDELVATYAAVTLAQAGEWKGLEWLIHKVCNTPERQKRAHWEACLRNCGRFPFAVLLNELAFLESIPFVHDGLTREFLEGLLALSRDGFYSRARRDAAYRERFVGGMGRLDEVAGLACRPKATCGMGLILSVPLGERPGFLYSPGRKLFFRFREAEVLNRDFVERGREAHYVVHREKQLSHPRSRERVEKLAYQRWAAGDGRHGESERHWLEAEKEVADDTASSAEVVYVFEDVPPRKVELPAEVVSGARRGGFVPGVVAATVGANPRRMTVACGDGRTIHANCPEETALGELALVEEDLDGGGPVCHLAAGHLLSHEAAGAVMRRLSVR
jgi:hypothetical protein